VELRHIRYFIEVAEQLNFRKAAQRLRIAQPPLSRQIRQLEDYLGVALFVRDKKRVELTKPGQAFLEEARKLIVQADNATEAARHAQNQQARTVRVGIASGLGGVVSQVIFGHRKQSPATEIECRDIFSSFQSEALRKHEIDVGFLRPPIDRTNLDCELLYEEGFVVTLPKSHRLAKRKSVRLKEIAGEPLIIFDRNFSSALYDKILGLYTRHGFTPRLIQAHVEPHEEAGAIMVAAGKGIFMGGGAIVNRSVSGLELALVGLNEPDAKIEIYAAWRKGEKSAAILGFLNTASNIIWTRSQRHSA
jgi:DNA-binding transcriptional LysR family regulator